MEEKETMKMGDCLVKYESHSGEGGIRAELEINGKGLDIIGSSNISIYRSKPKCRKGVEKIYAGNRAAVL